MATSAETFPGDGISIGRIFAIALSAIRQNAVVVFVLAFFSGSVPMLVEGYFSSKLLDAEGNEFSVLALSLIALTMVAASALSLLPQAFLTRAVVAHSDERRASLGECIRAGAAVLLPILALGLIYGVAVVLGLALLIVPGFFLMATWAVAGPVLAEERGSVIYAFRRSFRLTRGARWQIVGLLLLFFAIYLANSAVIELATGEWDSTTLSGSYENPIYIGLTGLTEALLAAFWCATIAALYVELRDWKDGPATENLEQIFA